MVVDASALLAVLLGESDALEFERALSLPARKVISSVNVFEVFLRAAHAPDGVDKAKDLLQAFAIGIVPIDAARVDQALDAHMRFGKGRHPAGLNLGDCFAYALAAELGEALLFKGQDFAMTDVARA